MAKHKMAHIYVEGMVQGVGFRFFVERHAIRLGLFGWVRNLYDGRVEIHTEGSEENINSFIEIMKEGPPSARLTNISIETEEIRRLNYKNFTIRQTGLPGGQTGLPGGQTGLPGV